MNTFDWEMLLQYNYPELALMALFAILFIMQLVFYCRSYYKPLKYAKKQAANRTENLQKPSVSVIILSKNESQNLEENLPFILQQQYPNFEVIVVNEGSTNESEDVLKRLSLQFPNLYHTFSPNAENRLVSMSIGIKAAKNDVLLFTAAACRPCSPFWIEKMMQQMTSDREVVVGYSYFTGKKPFLRISRLDNLFYSMRYLSRAFARHPYTGTYRNIAYRREVFFREKGFASVLNFPYSDEVFINRIMKRNNTAAAVSQDAFVSMPLAYYSMWRYLKAIRHRSQRAFKNIPVLFGIETVSRYLFYLLFVAILAFTLYTRHYALLGAAVLFFLLRESVVLYRMKKLGAYFKSPFSYPALLFYSLAHPLINLPFNRKKQKYRA